MIESSRSSLVGYLTLALALGLVLTVVATHGEIVAQLTEVLSGARPGSPAAEQPVSGSRGEGDQVRLSICAIQGRGFSSPYAGRNVVTRGVVTGDFDQTDQKGFFMQAQSCDDDPLTSDGIFVSLGARVQTVRAGDLVEVEGVVLENFGRTEVSATLNAITRQGEGHPLPPAIDLSPPFDEAQSRRYFESLEGMRVGLASGRIVGPTSRYGETWFVREDLGIDRVFHDDPAGTGVVMAADAAGLYGMQPPAKVGDRVTQLDGVLGFHRGTYRVHLIQPPVVYPVARLHPGEKRATRFAVFESALIKFTAATLNLYNLFDTIDDPGTDDPVPSASTYQRQLSKLAMTVHNGLGEPHLLAVQEAENSAVLADLLARPEIQSDYGILLVEGPDVRGIDVALLYRQDRVAVLDYSQHQGCTTLVDGLGPDGNRDVQNPENAITCDTDGDGILDGNRLFSRPPLVARLWVCAVSCLRRDGGSVVPPLEVWLIVNHWKSKTQDTEWVAHTLPRRVEQAQFAVRLATAIETVDPSAPLMILGDFNDTRGSLPVNEVEGAGFHNLIQRIPRPDRYTYIYQGVSQVLDHILVSSPLVGEWIEIQLVHLNADFPSVLADAAGSPYRASDHDPVLMEITLLPHKTFLPFSYSGSRNPTWKETADEIHAP